MTNNKTVLITGATSGIGLEFSKLFYEKGFKLLLVSRNINKLENIKEQIDSNKNNIDIIQSDLSKINSAQDIYNQCKNRGAVIDILVNNAGAGIYGEHVELQVDKVEEMITLNIISLTTLCSLFGKDMKERRTGYILNLASTAAYQAVPYISSYAATKSYVLNFSESLSKEMEDYNVVVSCLSPGHTDTNFFHEAGVEDETNGFFTKKGRANAQKVAEHGINVLFNKKISSIPGTKNKLLAWSNRFVSRNRAVSIAKSLTKKP